MRIVKKKNIVISIIVVAIVISVSIYLLVRPKALGSMNHSYIEPTTSSSDFSFSGDAGERIKFSFASDCKSGDLDIVLCDSEGNVVYKLDSAKELQTFYTLENTDTYTLTAEYTNFVGNFKVAVYPAK